jgi:hypothetical protein
LSAISLHLTPPPSPLTKSKNIVRNNLNKINLEIGQSKHLPFTCLDNSIEENILPVIKEKLE